METIDNTATIRFIYGVLPNNSMLLDGIRSITINGKEKKIEVPVEDKEEYTTLLYFLSKDKIVFAVFFSIEEVDIQQAKQEQIESIVKLSTVRQIPPEIEAEIITEAGTKRTMLDMEIKKFLRKNLPKRLADELYKKMEKPIKKLFGQAK